MAWLAEDKILYRYGTWVSAISIFYCTEKNDIARGACAECNIIFQSAIKIVIIPHVKILDSDWSRAMD